MLVLGIETSCDETGVALYDDARGLIAHALHSQVAMHQDYGGVVPELASRDHIRRLPMLLNQVFRDGGKAAHELHGVAYTAGPGLAGALLVGASVAQGLAYALGIPTVPVHHLEAHLLAPFLSADPPPLPFIALLVSGGHTQLMRVTALGDYELLGETLDDAAGEAFDKSAQVLGLGYPGGPALSRLAASGNAKRFDLPRPMLHSGDLDFSFSGLKTALLTTMRREVTTDQDRADLAASFQEAVAQVLVAKSMAALRTTQVNTLVVAGGVGANRRLRSLLNEAVKKNGCQVFYPEFEFCTDNGAMIALVGAYRLRNAVRTLSFGVKSRWNLAELPAL